MMMNQGYMMDQQQQQQMMQMQMMAQQQAVDPNAQMMQQQQQAAEPVQSSFSTGGFAPEKSSWDTGKVKEFIPQGAIVKTAEQFPDLDDADFGGGKKKKKKGGATPVQ